MFIVYWIFEGVSSEAEVEQSQVKCFLAELEKNGCHSITYDSMY